MDESACTELELVDSRNSEWMKLVSSGEALLPPLHFWTSLEGIVIAATLADGFAPLPASAHSLDSDSSIVLVQRMIDGEMSSFENPSEITCAGAF